MSATESTSLLDYYTSQSAITDPGDYRTWFDDLPRDLAALMKLIQGLWLYTYEIPPEKHSDLLLRTIPKRLERLFALDPAPLTTVRSPETRVYGLCRDYAVLLVAMLRHQGVPARERVGFCAYFDSAWYWDHRIAEYWQGAQQRWVLVDPHVQARPDKEHQTQVDPLNITHASRFLLAGEAWQLCRRGEADPDLFVDSPTDRGMAMIRYALLHDFDALNKVELVGMDAWHELIDKPEAQVTETERQLLDEIATLTVQPDAHFDQLRALYATLPYSRQVQARLQQALSTKI
ncbi:MAG: transglutaminase domain-containing protein [Caldilineaceae bacterium]